MEKQKTKKRKTYTYPVSATWTENDVEKSYVTQLYQIGVYVIFNNNPAMQGNMPPSGMVKLAKALNKSEVSGEITSLIWGRKINVSDNNGFWEEQ
ncbi:MAG: hypothetical protein EZS26_000992 [Candidatus Ordinivivax streblomastigis]|uniref:Uncharacterized protein n=1 Tax=Candidatus Ordinivivax streblomastigis TaxID=2540710 RepID=A0A5M8P3A2_9BACT|nr:MAG: hypothetical protein EZS26_000992 [Candidatus Ordinivivax streblomastigis]